MGTETITSVSGSTIANLESDWPSGSEDVSEGDNHLRNIKRALELTFPNLDGTVCASAAQLNLPVIGGTINGNLNVANALTVNGLAHLKDRLSVSGSAVVNGLLRVNGTLTVSAAMNCKTTLSVGGATHLNSTLSVVGAATVAGTLSVSGGVHCKTTLSVGGAGTYAGTQTFNGVTIHNDEVSVSGSLNCNYLHVYTSVVATGAILDENSMSSNSAVKLATQQSIKAYVDGKIKRNGTGGSLVYIREMSARTYTGGGQVLSASAHNLGGVPTEVRAYAVCTSANCGYAAGTRIEVPWIYASSNYSGIHTYATTANCGAVVSSFGLRTWTLSGSITALSTSAWTLHLVAKRYV